jgi:hypothetical protein
LNALMLLWVIATSASCAGSENPTGPSGQNGPFRLVLTEATGTRWAGTGSYAYQVSYTLTNTSSEPIQFTVSAALYGPNGERLPSDRILVPPQSAPWTAASTTLRNIYSFTDGSLANPWAERVTLRISYSGNKAVSAETQVTHGPPIARVYEFTVSPQRVRTGDMLTVKWNVSGAMQVRLSRWVADATSTSGPTVVGVEPVGSRTLKVLSEDARAVTLFVDDWGPLIVDINVPTVPSSEGFQWIAETTDRDRTRLQRRVLRRHRLSVLQWSRTRNGSSRIG